MSIFIITGYVRKPKLEGSNSQKHQRFIQQIGLVDITQERQERSSLSVDYIDQEDYTDDYVQQFEDTLEGGEVEV